MKNRFQFEAINDAYTGLSSISMKPITVTHNFWVCGKLVCVPNLNASDILSLANVVAMVNTFGAPYWNNLLNQGMMWDYIPQELQTAINTDIAQWTRDLKIESIVEEPIQEEV